MLSVGLVLGSCGVCLAGEISLDNGPEGAVFAVAGETPQLPNGTVLHVTLALQGKQDRQISFFQVRVQGERFSARKTWAKRAFAPLGYQVRVDLLMSEQPPALRRQLMREGYRSDERKLVSLEDVFVGTEEERDRFETSALEGLQKFLVRVQDLRTAVSDATKIPVKEPVWSEAERDLNGRLRACQRDLRAHLSPYLAWRDSDVIEGIQSGLNDVSRALRSHARSEPGAARDLIRVAHRLERVQGDVKARLALRRNPEPKPQREE